MKNINFWINCSILSLCTVAFLGMTLRSKMLFPLPFIDFNNLSNAHSHFAFSGWVTLALLVFLVHRLLPPQLSNQPVYQGLLSGVLTCSWCMLVSFYSLGNGMISDLLSFCFILITWAFAIRFIRDAKRAGLSKTVLALSISSLICLVLSAAGPIALAYLFSIRSVNVILYRDALFTYLHLQYNGFFTLAVFALLIHILEKKMDDTSRKNFHRFSVLLIISIIPSLFLSYLWQNPDTILRIVAVAGSLLVMLTFAWFIISIRTFKNNYRHVNRVIKILASLSMIAFAMKIFLQGFTIFPAVGNAVFGARPMIIGFLHLVFLGFVTLFLLALMMREKILNVSHTFTATAVMIFATGVVLNEFVLMTEGLFSMLMKSSFLFPWLLWGSSIVLFSGAVMIAVGRKLYVTRY